MLEKIREMALNLKEEKEKNGEDLKKINLIIDFLSDDLCFFKTNIYTSIPILLYLGVKEDNVKEVYFELINPKNFKQDNNVREAIDVDIELIK